MIHQLIFARPKPGMTEEDFQRYWVEVHAPKYASKIPQIQRYLIDTRIPFQDEGRDPPFSGIAEIWLENEKEQLESLQSKEFLQGARLDEPNWAAFWATLVLDTTTHVLLEGPPGKKPATGIKLMVLLKRKPGMALEDFRRYSLETHAPLVLQLPGLRRYLQCHVRDSFYVMGESRFDAVAQLSFDNTAALATALSSPVFQNQVRPDDNNFLDRRYDFWLVVKEHWIIGPEPRSRVRPGMGEPALAGRP
jgi:uncharacterized protein (TIGR02118 family)